MFNKMPSSSSQPYFLLALILIITASFSSAACPPENPHFFFGNNSRSTAANFGAATLAGCDTITIENIDFTSGGNSLYLGFPPLANRKSITLRNMHVTATTSGPVQFALNWYFSGTLDNIDELIIENNIVETTNGGSPAQAYTVLFDGQLTNVRRFIFRNNTLKLSKFTDLATTSSNFIYAIAFFPGHTLVSTTNLIISDNTIELESGTSSRRSFLRTRIFSISEAIINITTIDLSSNILVARSLSTESLRTELFSAPRITMFQEAPGVVSQLTSINVKNNYFNATILGESGVISGPTIRVITFETGGPILGLNAFVADRNIAEVGCTMTNSSEGCGFVIFYSLSLSGQGGRSFIKNIEVSNSHLVQDTIVTTSGPLLGLVRVEGQSALNWPTVGEDTIPAMLNNLTVHSCSVLVKNFTGPATTTFSTRFSIVFITSATIANISDGIFMRNCSILFAHDSTVVTGGALWYNVNAIHLFSILDMSRASIANVKELVLVDNEIKRLAAPPSSSITEKSHHHQQQIFTQGRVGVQIVKASGDLRNIGKLTVENNVVTDLNFGVYLDDREFSQAQFRVQFFMNLHIVAVDVTGEVFQPGITSFRNSNNNTHPAILFNNNTITNMRFEWSFQEIEVKYDAFVRPDIQLFTAVSISDSPSASTISILSNGISNIRAIARSPLANRINFENVNDIYNPFESLKGNPLYPSVAELQDELSGGSNIRATIINTETLSSVGNFVVDSNEVSDISCINCGVSLSTSDFETVNDVSGKLKVNNNIVESVFAISMESYNSVRLLFVVLTNTAKFDQIDRLVLTHNLLMNISMYSGEMNYNNPNAFRITGGDIVMCRISCPVSSLSAIIFINNTITDFFTTAVGLNNGVQISDVQGEIKNIGGSFSSSTPTTSSPSLLSDNNNNLNYEHEVADLMDKTEKRNWDLVESEMTGVIFLSNSISNGGCRGACRFAALRSYAVETFDRVLIRGNTMNHVTVVESGQLRSSVTLSSEAIDACIVQITQNVVPAPRLSSSTSILVIVNNNIEHMKLRASYIGSDTDITITFFGEVGLVPLLYFANNSISNVSAHITYKRRQTATVAPLFTRGIFDASSEQQICRLIVQNISVRDVNVTAGLDVESLYSSTSTVALVVTSSIGFHFRIQNPGTKIEVSVTNSSLLRVASNGSQESIVAGYLFDGFSSIFLADNFTVRDIEMNGIVASTNSSAQIAETKMTETNVAVLLASRSIENVRKYLVIANVILINVHVAGSIIHTGILIAEDIRESSLVMIDSARLSGIHVLHNPSSSLLRISALLLMLSHNDPSISNVKNITISNVVVSDVRMRTNNKNAGGIFGGDISITLMSDETSKGLVQNLSHLLISDSSIDLAAPSSTSELLSANGGVGVAAAILNGLAYPLQSSSCSFVFSNVSVRAVIGDSNQVAASGMLYVTNSIRISTQSPTESDLVIGRPMNTMFDFKFRYLEVDIDIQGNQHRNFSSSRDVIPSSVFFAGDNIQLNSTSYRHMTNRLSPTIEIEHCIMRQKSAYYFSSALFATSASSSSSALLNGTNTSILIRNNLVHSESRNLGSSSVVSFASGETHLVNSNSLNIEIKNNEFHTVLLAQDTNTVVSERQWSSQVSLVELNSLSGASSLRNHFVNINNNNNLLSIGIGDIGSSLVGKALKVSAISLSNVSSLNKGIFDIFMHDINVEVTRSSSSNQNPSISLAADVSLLSVEDGVHLKNASGSINASIRDCRARISSLGTNDRLSQFSLFQLPFALTDSSNINFNNNVMDVASSGPASMGFVAITEADSSSSSSQHSFSRITFHNNTMDLRASPVSICDLQTSSCSFMNFAFNRQFTSSSPAATTSSITFDHNSFLTRDHQRVLALVSTSGSAPLSSSSTSTHGRAALLNLTFLHQNTFGRPSARRVLLDDTPSSSSLLQMTQFNLGCSETANSWPQYVERQFLSFQTAKRQQKVHSPTVHWLCDEGFSHSTSWSYSRSLLTPSETYEVTETKQRTRSKDDSLTSSESLTDPSPSKSSSISNPYYEPFIADLTVAQAAVSAQAFVAAFVASPIDASSTMRMYDTVSLITGCPSHIRRIDRKSMYLYDPLPFPQSLAPGFSVFSSPTGDDYDAAPGGYIYGSLITFAGLLMFLLLVSLILGWIDLKVLRTSDRYPQKLKKQLTILSTAPVFQMIGRFLSMTSSQWVPYIGVMTGSHQHGLDFLIVVIIVAALVEGMLMGMFVDIYRMVTLIEHHGDAKDGNDIIADEKKAEQEVTKNKTTKDDKKKKNKKKSKKNKSASQNNNEVENETPLLLLNPYEIREDIPSMTEDEYFKKQNKKREKRNFQLVHRCQLEWPDEKPIVIMNKKTKKKYYRRAEPTPLKREVRSFLRSTKGQWLFVGFFSWQCVSSKMRKLKSTLPMSGPVKRLGKIVTNLFGPRGFKGKRISPHQRLPEEESVISDLREKYGPFLGIMNIFFSVLISFLRGVALERTEQCDTIRYVIVVINLFLSLVMLVLRPYLIPAKNALMIVSETLALTIAVLTVPNILPEEATKSVQKTVFDVLSLLVAIPILFASAKKIVFVLSGKSRFREQRKYPGDYGKYDTGKNNNTDTGVLLANIISQNEDRRDHDSSSSSDDEEEGHGNPRRKNGYTLSRDEEEEEYIDEYEEGAEDNLADEEMLENQQYYENQQEEDQNLMSRLLFSPGGDQNGIDDETEQKEKQVSNKSSASPTMRDPSIRIRGEDDDDNFIADEEFEEEYDEEEEGEGDHESNHQNQQQYQDEEEYYEEEEEFYEEEEEEEQDEK